MADALISRGAPTLESLPAIGTGNVNPHKILLWDQDSWAKFREKERKRLPHKGENYNNYLQRVANWDAFQEHTWTEVQAAKAARKARILHLRLDDLWLGWRTRAKFGRQCSCTDVVAHQSVHTLWPTLADFTRNSRKGCLRCWFIVQSIAAYGDRLAGRDPAHIQVNLRTTSPRKSLDGDFSRIRVRWLEDGSIPTLEPYLAQPPEQWRKLDLELYASEGMISNLEIEYSSDKEI